jgi:hypothetical protein
MTAGVARIISGGQTGADRAALDWAIEHRVAHGGWCPRGRRAEDGVIPARYQLTEMAGESYDARTDANVREADATVVLTVAARLAGGSRLTVELARRHGKPWIHLAREVDGDGAGDRLRDFAAGHAVRTLNVAGPRASHEPGIAEFVRRTLSRAFGTP